MDPLYNEISELYSEISSHAFFEYRVILLFICIYTLSI